MRARESEHYPSLGAEFSIYAKYTYRQRHGEWYIQEGDSLVPAPPDTHNEEYARIIFTEALVSLSKAAEGNLGDQKVPIGAVSSPQYFNGSSRGAVMLALQSVEPELRQLHQVVVGSHAIRLAYGLDSCEAFGFGGQRCDIEDGTHYVLVVEFEKRYLQLSLLDVASDTVGTLNRTRFNELGEEEGVTQDSGEDEVHYRHIQDELRAFMVNSDVGPKQKKEDFLQAVIVSGEASDESFEHLRRLIKELLDDQGKCNILRETVQPAFVSAVGAAYQSMLWVKSPELLDDVLDTNIDDFAGEVHDEL
jgi:hypothetical protein